MDLIVEVALGLTSQEEPPESHCVSLSLNTGRITRAIACTMRSQRDASSEAAFVQRGSSNRDLARCLCSDVFHSASSSLALQADAMPDTVTRARCGGTPRTRPVWRGRSRARAAAPSAAFEGSSCRACPAAARWSLRHWRACASCRRAIYSTRCQIVYYLGWVSPGRGGGPEGPPYCCGTALMPLSRPK